MKLPYVNPAYIQDYTIPFQSFIDPDYVGWICLTKEMYGRKKFHYWHIKNYEMHRVDGPASLECYNNNNKDCYTEYWLFDRMFIEEDYWNHPMVIKTKLQQILETT